MLHCFTIKDENFRKLESGNEEDITSNLGMELEELDEILQEEQIDVEAINMDELSCKRLAKLPLPRQSVSRNNIASLCMDQVILLKKMSKKRPK